MPRKPQAQPDLKVVPARVPAGPEPPAHLGEVAAALWCRVTADYQFDDPASERVLIEACSALDRAERCRRQITTDGEVVRGGRAGMLRAHPLLVSELQSRALACRLLQRLGLDLEPVRAGPGRPAGRGVGLDVETLSRLR